MISNEKFIKASKTHGISGEREGVFQQLRCPLCDNLLMCLMPDGEAFYCNKCEKYYKNNDGVVGVETTSPYIENDILY